MSKPRLNMPRKPGRGVLLCSCLFIGGASVGGGDVGGASVGGPALTVLDLIWSAVNAELKPSEYSPSPVSENSSWSESETSSSSPLASACSLCGWRRSVPLKNSIFAALQAARSKDNNNVFSSSVLRAATYLFLDFLHCFRFNK